MKNNYQPEDCIVIATADGQELHFPHIQDFRGRPFLTPLQIQKLFGLKNQACGVNPVFSYIRNHIYVTGKSNIWNTQPERCYSKFSLKAAKGDNVYTVEDMNSEMIQWVQNETPAVAKKTTWYIVYANGFMDFVKNNSLMSDKQKEEVQPIVKAMCRDFFRMPIEDDVVLLKSHREQVNIDGHDIDIYIWNGERTISTNTIARIHGIEPVVLKRIIGSNKNRFNQDGEEDFFEFRSYAGIDKLTRAKYSDLVEENLGKNRSQFLCRLFTHKGYLKLCLSILKDDKAQDIQESIITGIFNQKMPERPVPVIAPVTNEVAAMAEQKDVSIAQILYDAANRIVKLEKEKRTAVDERDEFIEKLRAELKSSQESGLYLTQQIANLKRAKENLELELQNAKNIERLHKQNAEQSMNMMSSRIAGLKTVLDDALSKVNKFENIFSAYGMDQKNADKKMEAKTINVNAADIEDADYVDAVISDNVVNIEEDNKAFHPATIAEDLMWARAASGMPATELVNRFAEAAGIDMSTEYLHEDEYSVTKSREISKDNQYITTVSFVAIKRKGIERILKYVKEHGREYLSHKLQNFSTYKTTESGHKAGEYSQIAFSFPGHRNDIKVKATGFDLKALGLTDAPDRRPQKAVELEEEVCAG